MLGNPQLPFERLVKRLLRNYSQRILGAVDRRVPRVVISASLIEVRTLAQYRSWPSGPNLSDSIQRRMPTPKCNTCSVPFRRSGLFCDVQRHSFIKRVAIQCDNANAPKPIYRLFGYEGQENNDLVPDLAVLSFEIFADAVRKENAVRLFHFAEQSSIRIMLYDSCLAVGFQSENRSVRHGYGENCQGSQGTKLLLRKFELMYKPGWIAQARAKLSRKTIGLRLDFPYIKPSVGCPRFAHTRDVRDINSDLFQQRSICSKLPIRVWSRLSHSVAVHRLSPVSVWRRPAAITVFLLPMRLHYYPVLGTWQAAALRTSIRTRSIRRRLASSTVMRTFFHVRSSPAVGMCPNSLKTNPPIVS